MNIGIDLDLEQKCWCCNGTGSPVGQQTRIYALPDGSCEMCRGRGWTPTDLGDSLLEFLRRRLKPECFQREGK